MVEFRFKCPLCGHDVKVNAAEASAVAECPGCGAKTELPPILASRLKSNQVKAAPVPPLEHEPAPSQPPAEPAKPAPFVPEKADQAASRPAPAAADKKHEETSTTVLAPFELHGAPRERILQEYFAEAYHRPASSSTKRLIVVLGVMAAVIVLFAVLIVALRGCSPS